MHKGLILERLQKMNFWRPLLGPKNGLGTRVALGIRQRGGYHRKERQKLLGSRPQIINFTYIWHMITCDKGSPEIQSGGSLSFDILPPGGECSAQCHESQRGCLWIIRNITRNHQKWFGGNATWFWDDYKNFIFDDPCFDTKFIVSWGVALGIKQRGGYHRKEHQQLL